MKMLIAFSVVNFLIVLSTIHTISSSSEHLLLVVLDGFRYDYIDREGLPGGLAKLRSGGTYAKQIVPVFPSLTYPNLNSLLTGLYPENQGFVSNVMYDPVHKTHFYSPKGELGTEPYWWNVTTPIWVTSTASNVTTGMYAWPRCDVKINNYLPDYCVDHIQYQEMTLAGKHIEDILIRFESNLLTFAMLYIEYPDVLGHAHGPDSPEMTKALINLDELFVDLMERLNEMNGTKVNIIVTTDHGMMTIESNASVHIALSDHLNADDINMVTGEGVVVGVYPKAARFDKVYNHLKSFSHMEVMKKQDIPDEYHLKLSDRTPPILLVAHPGYSILPLTNTDKQIPSITDNAQYQNFDNGIHGYDPNVEPQMNGIFLLYGPAFNKKYTAEKVQIVDVYNLMTCVLGIKGLPNNGSWDTICPFLHSNCSGFCHQLGNGHNTGHIQKFHFTAYFLTFVTALYFAISVTN